MKYRFIAIDGPMSSGKTDLTEVLGKHYRGRTVLDERDNNPFLELFYQDPERYAFQCQIFYLFNRYHQLVAIKQYDLFHQVVLCDYLFERDRLYAHVLLNDSELNLYDKIFSLLVGRVPKPDLVMVLQVSDNILWRRLRKLKKRDDYLFTKEFVFSINQAYNQFFYNYDASPLLILNVEAWDQIVQQADIQAIVHHIETLKGGRTYISPISSLGSLFGDRDERSSS
ncbi:deoxynucleoside kinase [candidate division CSSED10-310 bacterium]|uniref:Deoxynucleoside kinase n=1 Tax=candidate division CSSED10-310 bacterium TaxID=2855610 RepID=A0ABV6Z2B5_UNCC1